MFINVIKHCREREDVSGTFWGGIFGAFLVVMFLETVHMFDLNQVQQLGFFFGKMCLTMFLLLLVWGIFFKSTKVENQSPPDYPSIFLVDYDIGSACWVTNWLPQQRSDPPPKATAFVGEVTMEEYAEMGRVIIFGTKADCRPEGHW